MIKHFSLSVFLLFFLSLVFRCPFGLREVNTGKVVAYPNPYDPDAGQALVVEKRAEGQKVNFEGEIRIIVYDIGLRQIYKKDYLFFEQEIEKSRNVIWSGTTSTGNRISSGLYYIQLIESRADGSTDSEFVKVIVRR